MSGEGSHQEPSEDARDERGPSGFDAPAWVTEKLIELTLKVWQPYYKAPLSRHDAITMVLNVGQLFRVLSRESRL